MDEYRFQQRRKKRGLQCLVCKQRTDGTFATGLCGCGHRTPPSKSHKKRIVRRALERLLVEG